ALAELSGATLHFHPDWPDGRGITGTARFINTAMEVDLHGGVGAAGVSRVQGGIADFGDAILQLDVRGAGSGAALLGVLRQSPLHQAYGDYLGGLTLGGRGNVALALHIPLEAHLGEP